MFTCIETQEAYDASLYLCVTDSARIDRLSAEAASQVRAHRTFWPAVIQPYEILICLSNGLQPVIYVNTWITTHYQSCLDKPKFHLARLDSTRLDTFDFVEPVEPVETSVSSETSRALPTWWTTNML